MVGSVFFVDAVVPNFRNSSSLVMYLIHFLKILTLKNISLWNLRILLENQHEDSFYLDGVLLETPTSSVGAPPDQAQRKSGRMTSRNHA